MNSSRGWVIGPALTLLMVCADALAADSAGKLRAEMIRAEKEFIDLYNKVSTTPEFAIACRMETPTGTSFSVRICQPRYLVTANARAAGERMQSAIATAPATGAANSHGPNVGAGFAPVGADAGKEAAFKQNMLDTLQKSPELQALAGRRDDLQARYDQVTKGKGKH